MKTSELIGVQLDWAVAKCENFDGYLEMQGGELCYEFMDGTRFIQWNPSASWQQGGPIIERERITIDQKDWGICACIDAPDGHECNDIWANGDTPLVAAMRCYVASKLGDEVDVPEGLQ